MITVKNSEIEQLLLNISNISPDGKEPSGLVNEKLPLGVKRRLQKIHKALFEKYSELQADKASAVTECGEDKVKLADEIKSLMDEDVQIDREPIDLLMIESVETTNNYNFELLEKISM